MTTGSLMKVESIMHYMTIRLESHFFCLFESGCFTQVLLYLKEMVGTT